MNPTANRLRLRPRRAVALLAAGSVLGLALAGCSKRGGSGAAAELVEVDGSSTVFPITEAVAEEFQRRERVRVTARSSGTGGGFKRFCRGEVPIVGASRPIKPTELAACTKGGVRFIELPVAYDGIAIVVHPENGWARDLTVRELKTIWAPEAQEKVTRWSQVRKGWPDEELHLFGPGVDSGTYDYFTQAVVGREHASRGDFTSSEDDNVLVQGVSRDRLALGYFGLGYYQANRQRLRAVPVDDGRAENGQGPVLPSAASVADGTYQPLARPIFLYVAQSALERPAVASFATYYLEHAPRLSAAVGYTPLTARAIGLARERLARRTPDSAFGGHGSRVGVTVEQVLSQR
ncbi:MAG: PstS family phosphate ABC transporter substrate-binding protein [Deltaproteobacteria bacterium]|nr:PstS family phosphate ABC transporter substrate-binding protein [Deltaproteobacteria bacterium]